MKRPSAKVQINEMCKQCVYDERAPGTWREQVRDCCGYSCPLYDLRPLSADAKHGWQLELSEEYARSGRKPPSKVAKTEAVCS